MQTSIPLHLLSNPKIAEADAILRVCVHCGFCTATCPTYQLLGSELDSPRGRIYLIKEMLETEQASSKTRLHLDRCLTCRSCETTCPSGVQYGHLVDIGREIVDQYAPRSILQRLLRGVMLAVIPYKQRMSIAISLGRIASPLLPKFLKSKIPEKKMCVAAPVPSHARRMLVLEGCVQPLSSPNTNAAATRVLDKLGISLLNVSSAGCCGALNQHLADSDGAKKMMRQNIDAWWPEVEKGAEAIVMTASGCGVMVKDYGDALKHDALYAKKAARISALTRDFSEIIRNENIGKFAGAGKGKRIAYQSSCTLQHGQKLGGTVENILKDCGFNLTPVADSHLCCGAAGTYSILQPTLSQQLLNNKLSALQQGEPEVILTSNIGCQIHLASESKVPVMHWIELLDQSLSP